MRKKILFEDCFREANTKRFHKINIFNSPFGFIKFKNIIEYTKYNANINLPVLYNCEYIGILFLSLGLTLLVPSIKISECTRPLKPKLR